MKFMIFSGLTYSRLSAFIAITSSPCSLNLWLSASSDGMDYGQSLHFMFQKVMSTALPQYPDREVFFSVMSLNVKSGAAEPIATFALKGLSLPVFPHPAITPMVKINIGHMIFLIQTSSDYCIIALKYTKLKC